MDEVMMMKGGETDEWPEPVQRAFIELALLAKEHHFSVLCAVGLNHKHRRISAFFSPSASENPHLDGMCDDIATTFAAMAKRLRQ